MKGDDVDMTVKRFKLIYKPNTAIWDNFEDEEVFAWAEDDNPQEIVNKMNELHEEIQDLSTKKEDAEYELLHLKEKYEELLEENEQLKKHIEEHSIDERLLDDLYFNQVGGI